MRKTVIAVAVLAGGLVSAPVASADPVVPQQDAQCSSSLSGAMTWPPDTKMPLECLNGQWQAITSPQPPNDKWLSFGPTMTLHGEGMRNPSVQSGNWTATPQDLNSVCRAEQQSVVSPGVLGPPQVSEGKAGQQLSFQMVPRLFSIALSGYCLWERAV
jgi:hypothetical protein